MKKLLSKEKTLLMLMIVVMLALTACGDEKETKAINKEDGKANAEESTNPEETTKPTKTVQPTKNLVNPNVLNLPNYNYYGESDTEDVYLLAELLNSSKSEQHIIYFKIFDISGDHILAKCTTSTDIGVTEEGETQSVIEHKILLINRDSMEIEKELTLQGEYDITDKKNIFVVAYYSECKGTIYNNQLEIIGEYSIEDAETAYVSETGENAYYVLEDLLYKYNVKTKETTKINVNEICRISYINQVLTADGVDYISADVACFGESVINAQTGEVMYVVDDSIASYIDNNIYCLSKFGEIADVEWIVALDDKTQWKFTLENQNLQVKCMILDNGDVSFSYIEDDKLIIELFDGESGKLIGIQKIKVPYEEGYELTEGNVWLYDAPQYIDENTLMISIVSDNLDKKIYRYYIWNLKSVQGEGVIKSQGYVMGENSSRMINGVNYEKRELSSKLLPLKERTDKLEEKYGLDIYIGEECAGDAGGYSVSPYLNYNKIEERIETLESELEKYPLGFFEQFKTDSSKELKVYLVGYLVNVDKVFGATDSAGFYLLDTRGMRIFIDCGRVDNFKKTFHHEVAHAIDDMIVFVDGDIENALLSDEKWEQLNPKIGMYSFTYDDYEENEYGMYIYDEQKGNTSVKDTYFVDFYSMTFPTEDRARIFENVMTSENLEVDFNEAPYLKAKLNYYADCIRATFDTTGWGEVGWEAYK